MSASKAKQEYRRSRCATPAKTEYSCTRGSFCTVCTIWVSSKSPPPGGLFYCRYPAFFPDRAALHAIEPEPVRPFGFRRKGRIGPKRLSVPSSAGAAALGAPARRPVWRGPWYSAGYKRGTAGSLKKSAAKAQRKTETWRQSGRGFPYGSGVAPNGTKLSPYGNSYSGTVDKSGGRE